MGRHPLLTLVALVGLASCSPEITPGRGTTSAEVGASGTPAASGVSTEPTRPAASDPHALLACVQCHKGGLVGHRQPGVPTEACTASGCHKNDVVGTVALTSVRFDHQSHVTDTTVAVGCAGCHTHEAGGQPLTAGPETCGLCHYEQLSGARGEECRLCHADPNWVGMTSQSVPVPHEGLPWIEGGCLRCHYEVTRPVHQVSLARCAACHEDVDVATRRGIGDDLHPSHTGVGCSACHEADNHRIEAMSSAVDLACSKCHAQAHDANLVQASLSPATCNPCHGTTHQQTQRLLLGLLPDSVTATPSNHFMNGLTCRSCHREASGSGNADTGQACTDCHRSEYATVLTWWRQGLAERTRVVDRYLAGAERAVAGRPATDPAVQAVARARSTMALLATGGGEHNIPLAQRMFRNALNQATEAYRLAGRVAPVVPSMGRAPRPGLCTYCHYRLQEPVMSDRMDDAFHRAVVGK